MNTCPLDGDREYYEVHDRLWREVAHAPGIGQSDNGPEGYFLCIGCLEERIGRKLTPKDFKPATSANMPSPWFTTRLNDRLGAQPVTEKKDVYQSVPAALMPAVLDKFHPHEHWTESVGGCARGVNCEWTPDTTRWPLGPDGPDWLKK